MPEIDYTLPVHHTSGEKVRSVFLPHHICHIGATQNCSADVWKLTDASKLLTSGSNFSRRWGRLGSWEVYNMSSCGMQNPSFHHMLLNYTKGSILLPLKGHSSRWSFSRHDRAPGDLFPMCHTLVLMHHSWLHFTLICLHSFHVFTVESTWFMQHMHFLLFLLEILLLGLLPSAGASLLKQSHWNQ